jgi:hypothetical protein
MKIYNYQEIEEEFCINSDYIAHDADAFSDQIMEYIDDNFEQTAQGYIRKE